MTAAQLSQGRETVIDEPTERLWRSLSIGFLELINWSPETRVLSLPQEHPLLGWRACAVATCDELVSDAATGFCHGCHKRWKAAGAPDAALFAVTDRGLRRRHPSPCRVRGCARPQLSRRAELCASHHHQRTEVLKVPVEQFLDHPAVVSLPTHGQCEVMACVRDRVWSGPYCNAHYVQWNQHRRRSGESQVDEHRWRRTTPPVALGGEINLRGLPDRIVGELLYGLQQRTFDGIKTRRSELRSLANHLRACEALSLEDEAARAGMSGSSLKLVKSTVSFVRCVHSNPETERSKDNWDARVFGYTGTLRFGALRQPWLKEAAKRWAYDDLPRRRGEHAKSHCQTMINHLAYLSESLHVQRADHGIDPTALNRADATAFLNRIAFLHAQGTLSAAGRLRHTRGIRKILVEMRALGLTRAGEPMHGLPDDFAVLHRDVPDEADDDVAGRDLPIEVVRHLCAHLDRLEDVAGTEIRVAVELLIDTGRRPVEICSLDLDCLERDAAGEPVLVYDNIKANRLGRRLPIKKPTAALIEQQQRRVRARFPSQPAARLKLLPAPTKNPIGAKHITDTTLGSRHRNWVADLPDVAVPMTVEVDGKPTTAVLPFDKAKIFLYAYRHTYAQRHADAGVPVDVLRELMDHRNLHTTQGYYQVGQQRRRDAVDRVAALQFDRHGNRTWREAKALLDSEHLRRAVGEVAVPYGTCSEPSNVAAGGEDCPVRFRCVGCAHFSTDVSYLPDLQNHLDALLRSRERLRSLTVDAWAKAEAMPSDEEIAHVRRLISRITADLDELPDPDRAGVEEAITVVRNARTRMTNLGLPQIRPSSPDVRPDRSA
ncbi:tyrosine-type recombinase/integrase [Nocardia cyriacigeorgica]|uniref:tyrosine-type recombinase/integrase n=1 Tax=Nocardia cyriacigeorgica TaxID=135487 RepID=UPI002457B1F5|nr:site-specific integrase [Nocardia cyriacigeorgica]